MERLKVGIIGLGVGEHHIPGYERHPACEVVSLCDFSPEKLAAAAEKYPTMKLTREADEVLEDPGIDIVSIASFDNYHFPQMAKAIRRGKHVFVEKPLCLYTEEAVQLRALLRERPDLRISSNLVLRASPRFRQVKDLLEQGALGELFYIEGDYNYGRLWKLTDGWRGDIDFYSVVYGGALHLIDLILWLTGDTVVEVSAYGNNIASRNSKFRHMDLVAGLLKFASGRVGKVTANFGCVFPHFHVLNLYGTQGTFINSQKYGLLYTRSANQEEPKAIDAAYPGVHKAALIPSFVDSILNGRSALVTQDDVFKSMSVCFALEKAAQEGGPVTVNYI
jgi:predicted dehydrogenase